MIGSAESQNKFKDKQVERNELTELQQFTQDLNAQLLNSVSRSLFTNSLGTMEYRWELHFGSLSIEVYPSSGGLTVDILDTKQESKHK
jgi:curli production assembly/transport component CsgF